MILALDLSSKCTGWAKFSKDGKLLEKGRISPKKDIANFFKIHYLVEQIKPLFNNCQELIIEDIYLGVNFKDITFLARLSGAVAYAWVVFSYKEPHFMNASHARKLVGLNGRSQKAEIQVYVLKNYTNVKKEEIKKYEDAIVKIQEDFKNKEFKIATYKKRMGVVSELIDKETGIGEDTADSIVLGLAYVNECEIQKLNFIKAKKAKRAKKSTRKN